MILHTVNKPSALSLCLPLLANDDIVLLIEDGIYALAENTQPLQELNCHVLKSDIYSRGMEERIPDWAIELDARGFVELVTQCDKVQSWF
ncbi:MAG: sulfurtransferase complex subunit TusB [Pseudomonadales bacterium]